MDRVAHGGGGVMVWAGVCYGQRTQVHFIDGILNAQRYLERRAEIAFGLVLYCVPCQCRALAWPFIVINRKACSAELE